MNSRTLSHSIVSDVYVCTVNTHSYHNCLISGSVRLSPVNFVMQINNYGLYHCVIPDKHAENLGVFVDALVCMWESFIPTDKSAIIKKHPL